MRTIVVVLVIVIAVAIGAAFYFGLLTMSAGHQEQDYVVNLVVHPDFMMAKHTEPSEIANGQALQAKGRIVGVNPEKSEFVLTENFDDMTFKMEKGGTITINGQASKLADLKGGDQATVEYTKQGQTLLATMVRCTRKSATD
jgi:hypothetical protein